MHLKKVIVLTFILLLGVVVYCNYKSASAYDGWPEVTIKINGSYQHPIKEIKYKCFRQIMTTKDQFALNFYLNSINKIANLSSGNQATLTSWFGGNTSLFSKSYFQENNVLISILFTSGTKKYYLKQLPNFRSKQPFVITLSDNEAPLELNTANI